MTNTKRIISVILCLIMMFSLCSCGGKVVTSQIFIPDDEVESDDGSSVDNQDSTSSENSSVNDVSSENASSKDNSSKNSSKTPSKNSSKESSEANKVPGYPEQVEVTVPKTFSGFCGDPGIKISPVADLWGSDYVNCTVLRTGDFDMSVQMCMQEGIFFWVNMASLCEAGIDKETDQMKIRADWRENMNDIADAIKKNGAWNYFLGWYMDEPLFNRFSPEDVLMFTEYNHNTFQKRYFICFAVEGIAPEGYSDGSTRGHMSKETTKYLTDCAYDMYWNYGKWEEKYKLINKCMKERLPEDCNIWYFPWCYGSKDKTTMEKLAEDEHIYIEHLNAMYNFLKEEKHPGGLLPFLFNGDRLNFYGIEEMVEAGYWTELFNLCKKYGKELVGKKVNK